MGALDLKAGESIKANVLLVNDRPDQLLALETILAPLQQVIVKANSGKEALHLLINGNFAVILLDVKMPGMDGFETATLIRQRKKNEFIPIIFISAYQFSLRDQFSGYSLGAVDYIQSPVEPEILRAKTRAFVELYQKRLQVQNQVEYLREINENLKREIEQRIYAEIKLARSEQNFRQLAENIREVFWIQTADMKEIIYMSPLYEEVWGRSVANLFKDPQEWFTAIMQEDQSRVLDSYEKLKQGENAIVLEYKILRPDGTFRWIYARTFRILNEAGEFYRVAGIAADITEQKHLEDVAFQHKHRLELAELERVHSMGEMASALAHELTQPLAAITTYTQGCMRKLQEEPANGKTEILEAMSAVVQQSERAGEIIHHMKNFVRKGKLLREATSINELINKLTTLINHEAQAISIQVHFDLAEALPLAHVNKVQIEQVLLNLVRNSVEAMRDAKIPHPKLTIATAMVKDMLLVSCTDNGPGFKKDLIPFLFKPYVTTKSKGTGMGLAISRTIVEAHGGQLWIESNKKSKVSVCFTLPIAKV